MKKRVSDFGACAFCGSFGLANDEYFLQTKFEVRTVSYGPSFVPKPAGHNWKGKNEGPSLTVRTEKTRFVRHDVSLRLIRRAEEERKLA